MCCKSPACGGSNFEATVNGDVHLNIITKFIALLDEDERYCWFQRDGATCHTSNETMAFLWEFFADRLISKIGGLQDRQTLHLPITFYGVT